MDGGAGAGKLRTLVRVLTASPQFRRTCAECRTVLIGENGVVSTRRARGTRPGEVIELPMLRSEVGIPPPCGVCPKIPDRDAAGHPVPKHWSNAVEFEDWFWACRQWYRECKAVGTFGNPSPAMRAVARVFHEADEAAARDDRARLESLLIRVALRR